MRAWLTRFLLIAFALSAPAAANAGPASELIEKMAAQAIETLQSTDGGLAEREKRFRRILTSHFDMETIAKSAIGRHWNRASADQRQRYIGAFSDYVVATYARRFGGYAGETFAVVGERSAGGDDMLVDSEIRRGEGPPIVAQWRVQVGDGAPKVVDVIVENVSMTVTQRSEFSAVVRSNGIDGLIQVLQARAGRVGAQQ